MKALLWPPDFRITSSTLRRPCPQKGSIIPNSARNEGVLRPLQTLALPVKSTYGSPYIVRVRSAYFAASAAADFRLDQQMRQYAHLILVYRPLRHG